VVVPAEIEKQAATGMHQRAEAGSNVVDHQVDVGHAGTEQGVIVTVEHRVAHVESGHHAGEISVSVG
jgi:hypothetical protein